MQCIYEESRAATPESAKWPILSYWHFQVVQTILFRLVQTRLKYLKNWIFEVSLKIFIFFLLIINIPDFYLGSDTFASDQNLGSDKPRNPR